tara:strand:- start:15402 stop:16247 length:846 start_codon:yes stop_codon:yes gene_type:complete
MANCLVTGHKGYIGSKLFAKLVELGHNVYGVDIASDNIDEKLDIRHHLFHNNKPWLKCKPDYIFHLAAKPSVSWSVENPSESLSHNVLGSSRVLEFAKAVNAKRVIFASSAAIYGASSPYGIHKLMTEKECKLYADLYDIDTVCLRYFNVYSKDQKYGGPYSTVISAWMEMIRQNKPLRIDGDGSQTRDFIHVNDIVNANIFCMNYKNNFNGAACDIGTGVSTSLSDIRNIINNTLSVDWDEQPSRIGDIQNSKADVKYISKLGWSPQINIESGLKQCFGE